QAQVDRVILAAEAGIMPHHLGLGQAGETDVRVTLEPGEARARRRHIGEIHARRAERADLEDQRLFEHQRAIAGEGCRVALALLGGGRAPAACVDIAHASASRSAEASVSTSSDVVVSVTATTR